MIEEISIENLGVISAAQLSFGSGMNVLTGETGAGKTMVLTSLMLLMGAKATAAKVRHGEERANITGVFRVPAASLACEIVARAGGKVDSDGKDAEIIVSRQVLASGRSRAYLGGVNVPIVTLQEIAAELFTVHGQQDQIRLASKTEHLQALDQYIGLRGMRISQEYLEKWQKCQELSRKLTQEKANVAAIAAERLALEALIKRVDAVDPKLGEDDELRAQAMRLDNIEALRSALAQSVQLLEGDEYQPGAVNMIDTAQRELSQTHDPDLESSAKTLAESTTIISQVLSDLVTALENLDADPEQLNAIHQRRADLTALTRELGMDIPTILAKREDANNRLQEITDPDTYLAQLSASLAKAEAECAEMAAKITAFRKKGQQNLRKMFPVSSIGLQ
ncbi:AAA family ATPase [Arcanobacterium hippocoleae]|uniref:AAA family ATPase n=1 Tax=Arcanobacterium hippocoleae TaxID=149017 RepID=UPI003341A6EE